MTNDKSLREHLANLLKSGDAHADFDAAVKGLAPQLQGKRPEGASHSAWEILEHMRLAQWDILEFTRNPKHVSPEFPGGYWPATPQPPNDSAWIAAADAFRADLAATSQLVENEATDLFARIPHGSGQTVLREALVLADHNAYHLGELILLRRLLNAWP
jgi:hypothetical protein